jgi:hypothetical protein
MTIAIDPGTLRGKAGIVDEVGMPGCVGAQTALHEFTDRLYRSQSEADVYDAALDAIRHALGCERASILLFDASGTMKFVAWGGLSDGYRKAVEGYSPWTRGSSDPKPICILDIDTADIDDALKATAPAWLRGREDARRDCASSGQAAALRLFSRTHRSACIGSGPTAQFCG